MHGVRALEPVRLEVLRPKPERGAAILDEAALAAGLDQDADAPRRRYYALTRDGERALTAGRRSWRRFVSATETILRP